MHVEEYRLHSVRTDNSLQEIMNQGMYEMFYCGNEEEWTKFKIKLIYHQTGFASLEVAPQIILTFVKPKIKSSCIVSL